MFADRLNWRSLRWLLVASACSLIGVTRASAQTPTLMYACYVPLTGTTYRIKEPGLKTACTAGHIEFSWDPRGGVVGPTGPQGPSGPPGPTGPAGQNGSGTPGPQGPTGPIGPQGPVGATGAVGPSGAVGPTGSQGPAGANGAVGATGPEGPTGPAGALGPTGPAGPPGATDPPTGGDLAGVVSNASVIGLRGVPVSSRSPVHGQVLSFDGGSWLPLTPATGVTAHSALTGLNNDDHPQYLLTSGGRNSLDGFAVIGTLNSGGIPVNGAGTRMMWYPGKAAFRVGEAGPSEWEDSNTGKHSFATGFRTQASGAHSVAFGNGTNASNTSSAAFGSFTVVSGSAAFASGISSVASGLAAAAFGDRASADGSSSFAAGQVSSAFGKASIALGETTFATGDNSFVAGRRAASNGQSGSFVYGDASTLSIVLSTTPNQFVVRASGGFRFRTASDLSTGCDLPAGSGTFACTSDRNRKNNFQPVDGEFVLDRIARMPITSWSYTTEQNGVRHMGPTAQDFRAAFGLGIDDLTISTVDIDGVNLAGVKALELRTTQLRAENAELRARLERLEAVLKRFEQR